VRCSASARASAASSAAPTDRGLVAVLDPRIVTKPYGPQFTAPLPDDIPVRRLDEEAAARDVPADEALDEATDELWYD
jgi:hypothetical protein